MFFSLMLWALLHPNTVLAASLPQRSDRIGSLDTGRISSSNLLSPAIPAPSSNFSSGNVLQIACDSAKFGKNLKVNSCRNIFRYLMRDEVQYTFAERDSGVPHDAPLPWRTLSGEKTHRCLYLLDTMPRYLACMYRPSYTNLSTTGDGLCFVQPTLKRGAISGHASGTEVGQAAFTLLQTCVIERGMGGVAYKIGECPTVSQP